MMIGKTISHYRILFFRISRKFPENFLLAPLHNEC
jgi:hypothetical protein